MPQVSNAHLTTPTYYEPERVSLRPDQHKLRVLIDEIATTRGLTIQMSLRLMTLVAAQTDENRREVRDEFCALAEHFKRNMTLIFGTGRFEDQPTEWVDWIRQVASDMPARRQSMETVDAVVGALHDRVNKDRLPTYDEARVFHITHWPIVRDEMTKLIWDLWADLDMQKIKAVDGMEKLSDTLASTLGDIKQISMTVRMVALNAGVLASRAGDDGVGFSVIASEIKKLAEDIQTSASRADGVVIEMNSNRKV